MRYLVLSDIHANDVAFEAVLSHAERQRWDKVVFLGDVVGYYPAAEAVTTLLRELEPVVAILGNHDAMLLDSANGGAAHPADGSLVARIVGWHARDLSDANLEFVRGFETHVLRDGWEATHGGLRRPWEYLSTLPAVQANMPLLQRDLCLVGHTHIPMIYACVSGPNGELWRTIPFRGERSVYRIPPKARVFFNPGSVGQPRDGVPQASYAIFDEDAYLIEHFRVPFDLVKVQRQVRAGDYPEVLAHRLETGR